MKISDVFPSKYLKAEDLEGANVTVTIEEVNREEVGPKKESKLVISFVTPSRKWCSTRPTPPRSQSCMARKPMSGWAKGSFSTRKTPNFRGNGPRPAGKLREANRHAKAVLR